MQNTMKISEKGTQIAPKARKFWGYIIKLKKGPLYKKGPPLLGTDLEQGGGFLKCNSERKSGPKARSFWGFTLLKLRFSRQKLFKKRAKSSKFSPPAGSGQEESSGRGLNKVKYQMFMIFIKRKMVLHLHKK